MLVDQSFTAAELGAMLGMRGSRLLAVVRALQLRGAGAAAARGRKTLGR